MVPPHPVPVTPGPTSPRRGEVRRANRETSIAALGQRLRPPPLYLSPLGRGRLSSDARKSGEGVRRIQPKATQAPRVARMHPPHPVPATPGPTSPRRGEVKEASGMPVDARGHPILPPRCSATAKMSLSPRPDRLTTIRWSFGLFGASSSTLAMACAGSSAGMIPSSFERS